MAALIKADQAPKKRQTAAAAKKGAKVSNEDARKKEKEEKARMEEEKRDAGKRALIEKQEVSKEVAVFNQRLMRVKEAF